ncbi:MAG: DUF4124 domain-containing protein [Gammaproteobacteria bacterium]|nr:DUF4124 domain-containing protein [Gammaproteobacteria bacterium]
MRTLIQCFLILMAFFLTTLDAEAGKLYKWVDENGKVHYTDTPPPESSSKEREVLNDQGMVTETLAREKTPDEVAAEEAAARDAAERKRIEDEIAAKDRMLLSTYTRVEELEMARDGRIQALDAQIRVVSGSISTLEDRLTQLEQQTKQIEANGRPVPENLSKQLEDTREELLQNQKFLFARQQEQEQIREQFTREIARFKELRGIE